MQFNCKHEKNKKIVTKMYNFKFPEFIQALIRVLGSQHVFQFARLLCISSSATAAVALAPPPPPPPPPPTTTIPVASGCMM
ncbi:hypothetical protein T10_13459 [Trichinella papuae]|uniref:Uncharacterized protein n=1 Tax=Trichinella papuae TaxID=268474 RepID=A0A0V1M8E7_9BILA|nr:hypothetical protein T10_13459 [Trichinella papuae]